MSLPLMSIFNGRERGVEGDVQRIYMKLYVEMRNHLHLFNNGKNSNSLAIFLAIALHANEDGWAWPSADTVKDKTGVTDDHTVADALKHLREIRIDGKRIMDHYRVRIKGQWGRSFYHVFPEAGGGDKLPTTDPLILWLGQPKKPLADDPQVGEPVVDDPLVGDPHVGDPQDSKGEPESKVELSEEESKRAAAAPARSSQAPRARRGSYKGSYDATTEGDKDKASDGAESKRKRSDLETRIIGKLHRKRGLPYSTGAALDAPKVPAEGPEVYASPVELWDTDPLFKQFVDWAFDAFKKLYPAYFVPGAPDPAYHFVNFLRDYESKHGWLAWREARVQQEKNDKIVAAAQTSSSTRLAELIKMQEEGEAAAALAKAQEKKDAIQ